MNGTVNALLQSKSKRSETSAAPKISGICKIDGLPCQTILLVLKDRNGREIAQTRTAADGTFAFPVPADTSLYTLETKTRGYDIHTEPADFVRPGTNTVVSLIPRR